MKLGQAAYGEPRLTFQPIYRLICQSLLNRHLTNTCTSVGYVPRVNTGRTSTNVGQYIDRDIIDSVSAEAQLLVKYRSTTGGILVNCWSCISH